MTTININGMAHVMLSVASFAAAREFYGRLLPAMGMTPVCDTEKLFYCVGGRTAIGIQPATESGRFEQGGIGLHHLCLRPGRARTSIACMSCCGRWEQPSSRPRRKGHGLQVTTRCYSRTRTASGWRQTSSPVLASLRRACRLIHPPGIKARGDTKAPTRSSAASAS